MQVSRDKNIPGVVLLTIPLPLREHDRSSHMPPSVFLHLQVYEVAHITKLIVIANWKFFRLQLIHPLTENALPFYLFSGNALPFYLFSGNALPFYLFSGNVFLTTLSPLLVCSFLHLCRSGDYIAFCVSGYRSAIATSLLRKAGFRVRDIFGGFAAINFTAPSYTTSGAVSPPTDTLYYYVYLDD